MIKGVHAMFYSDKAEEMRAFVRDKLQLKTTDVGGGWLIFDFDKGDMGVHPTNFEGAPKSGTHDISFFCDDIHKTVEELKGRGVEFDGEITDQGYGHVIAFTMPGGVKVELYQPKYAK